MIVHIPAIYKEICHSDHAPSLYADDCQNIMWQIEELSESLM